MQFVSAINVGHSDKREVSHFLCDHFEFKLIAQDESSITVNNGVLSIRFHDTTESNCKVYLDLESTDLEESSEELKSIGFEPHDELKNAGMFRKEQTFLGPHGLEITLHQVLTEDDLGIHPELDKTLDWEVDTEEMAKSLLSHVTIHFRDSARKKMVKQAEALALIEGNLEVGQDEMVTAFLYTTPYFKQDALQELLIQKGISQAFIDEQLKKS